jgi:hypothetical protein
MPFLLTVRKYIEANPGSRRSPLYPFLASSCTSFVASFRPVARTTGETVKHVTRVGRCASHWLRVADKLAYISTYIKTEEPINE